MNKFIIAAVAAVASLIVAERSEACNYPTAAFSYGACAPAPVTTYVQRQYVAPAPVVVEQRIITEYVQPVKVEVVAPQQTYVTADPCPTVQAQPYVAPVQAYATQSFVNVASVPYAVNTFRGGYGYGNVNAFRGHGGYANANFFRGNAHFSQNRFFGGGFQANVGVQKVVRGQQIVNTVTRSRTVERIRTVR